MFSKVLREGHPRRAVCRALVLTASLLGVACGTSAIELSFLTTEAIVLRGQGTTTQLKVHAKNRDGAPVKEEGLFWTTSAPNIATVERGVVKAVGPGVAVITVKAGDLEAVKRVTVFLPVSMEIRPQRVDLYGEGRTAVVAAILRDSRGRRLDAQPKWTTTDPAVATVEGDRVTSKRAGITRLTAREGELTAFIDVHVFPAPISRIDIGGTRVVLAKGKKFRMKAKAYDAQGRLLAGVPIQWHSSDERVVRLEDDGLLIGESEGTTVVSAISGLRKAGAIVEVRTTTTSPAAIVTPPGT